MGPAHRIADHRETIPSDRRERGDVAFFQRRSTGRDPRRPDPGARPHRFDGMKLRGVVRQVMSARPGGLPLPFPQAPPRRSRLESPVCGRPPGWREPDDEPEARGAQPGDRQLAGDLDHRLRATSARARRGGSTEGVPGGSGTGHETALAMYPVGPTIRDAEQVQSLLRCRVVVRGSHVAGLQDPRLTSTATPSGAGSRSSIAEQGPGKGPGGRSGRPDRLAARRHLLPGHGCARGIESVTVCKLTALPLPGMKPRTAGKAHRDRPEESSADLFPHG